MYVIAETDIADSFWNNESGFGSLDTADVFTESERRKLNLPIGGEWMKLPTPVSQLAKALADVVSSEDEHDIQRNTGMPMERCREIRQLFLKYCC